MTQFAKKIETTMKIIINIRAESVEQAPLYLVRFGGEDACQNAVVTFDPLRRGNLVLRAAADNTVLQTEFNIHDEVVWTVYPDVSRYALEELPSNAKLMELLKAVRRGASYDIYARAIRLDDAARAASERIQEMLKGLEQEDLACAWDVAASIFEIEEEREELLESIEANGLDAAVANIIDAHPCVLTGDLRAAIEAQLEAQP